MPPSLGVLGLWDWWSGLSGRAVAGAAQLPLGDGPGALPLNFGRQCLEVVAGQDSGQAAQDTAVCPASFLPPRPGLSEGGLESILLPTDHFLEGGPINRVV